MQNELEDGRKVIGSEVTTKTFCSFGEDEHWHVTQTITQKRLIEGDDEWEERTIEMEAHARRIEIAVANAIMSLDQYLTSRNGDLFNDPKQLANSTNNTTVANLPSKALNGEYIH